MVTTRDVEIVYQRGGDLAVRGLTLSVGAGEGLLLTGEHGAGKTTFLRGLLGLMNYSGEIRVFGSELPGTANRRIGYGPQGRTFLGRLRPQELVATVAALRTPTTDASVTEALTRAGLPTNRHGARTLEVDELRRVALACAIVGDPALVILDDPWEFVETHEEIARARSRGAAVIVATHDPGGFPARLGRTVTLEAGGHA